MTTKKLNNSTVTNDSVKLKRAIKQIALIIRKNNFSHADTVAIFSAVKKQCELKPEPKQKNRMPVLPSNFDVDAILKASECNHTHWSIIQTLSTTGCRVSELINIKVEDIYFDELKIFIRDGKTGDRYILFPKYLTVHFKQLINDKRPDQYLFMSRLYKQYTRFGINNMLNHYAKLQGINKSIHPHLFRHLYCTRLSSVMSESELMILSGHANKDTLAIYQHLNVNSLIDKYNQVFSKP